MTRFEIRWLRRHPLRWARVMWLPWLLALLLVLKAIVIAEPVFAVVSVSELWPVILGMTGGVVLTSAFAPLEPRLQAAVAAILFGVSVLRLLTYVHTLALAGAALSADARMIVAGFMIHWAVMAALAAWLPVLLEEAGRRMTVEAGRDDRARD